MSIKKKSIRIMFEYQNIRDPSGVWVCVVAELKQVGSTCKKVPKRKWSENCPLIPLGNWKWTRVHVSLTTLPSLMKPSPPADQLPSYSAKLDVNQLRVTELWPHRPLHLTVDTNFHFPSPEQPSFPSNVNTAHLWPSPSVPADGTLIHKSGTSLKNHSPSHDPPFGFSDTLRTLRCNWPIPKTHQPVLQSLRWLPIKQQNHFKALHQQPPPSSYLTDLDPPYPTVPSEVPLFALLPRTCWDRSSKLLRSANIQEFMTVYGCFYFHSYL